MWGNAFCMFSFDFDKGEGVLTVKVIGQWTLADVPPFEKTASAHYGAVRAGYGSLRVLIDNTEAALFTQDVIGALTEAGSRLGRGDDRIATLVKSSLMKLQMKRILPEEMAGVFVSRDEAVTWLTADADEGSSGGLARDVAA